MVVIVLIIIILAGFGILICVPDCGNFGKIS